MYIYHRRKFDSTSKYIYKTLFEEGRASDVTVVALGTEWHLHKVYLCQVRDPIAQFPLTCLLLGHIYSLVFLCICGG